MLSLKTQLSTFLLLCSFPLKTLATNYGATCTSNPDVGDNHYFTAYCLGGSPSPRATTMDLNLCISNYFGSLISENDGNYEFTCNQCIVQGTTLTCVTCGNGHGTYNAASIDLNSVLGNDQGHLVCWDHFGT